MLKKVVLAGLATSLLLMSGCSSYPSSSEKVAEEVSKAFKNGNLAAAKKYMSSDALAKTEQNEGAIKQFFSLPEFKQKARGLDCHKAQHSENIGQDHEKFFFGEFNVELKKIDGK